MIERIKRKELFKNQQYSTIFHNDVYVVYEYDNRVLACANDQWVISEKCWLAEYIPAEIADVNRFVYSFKPSDSPRLRDAVIRAESKGVEVETVYCKETSVDVLMNIIDWSLVLQEAGYADKALAKYVECHFFCGDLKKPSELPYNDPFWYEDNPLRAAAAKAIVEAYDFETLRKDINAVLDGIREEFRRIYENK